MEEDLDLYVTKDDNQEEMIRLYRKMEKNYQYIYEKADDVILFYDGMLETIDEVGG